MTEQEMREKLDNGLCIKCGKPILDKRGICQECYDSLSQIDKNIIRLLWEAFRIVGNKDDGN
jgi:predicted amidophosphoribosyltransferase